MSSSTDQKISTNYHYVITLSDPNSGRSATAYGVIPLSPKDTRSQIFKQLVTTIATESGINSRPLVTYFSLEPDQLSNSAGQSPADR